MLTTCGVPWKISTQVNYLEMHPDVGLVYNTWILITDDSNETELQVERPAADIEYKLNDRFIRLYLHKVINGMSSRSSGRL